MVRKTNLIVSCIFVFFLATFICIIGTYNASADPEPLPFSFPVPSLDDLQWDDIDNDGGCFPGVENALVIDDAMDAMGTNDAYDGAWNTLVGITAVDPNGIGDLTGNTYTSQPQNISGLAVTYQLYFSEDTQCNRLVLFFDNNTGSTISDTVQIATNFGSDDFTQIDGTSSGDTSFTTADRWLVTSDGGDEFDPVNTTVFYGPGIPSSTPTSASINFCGLPFDDNAGVAFDIEVPGNQTRCLMLFGCLADITGLDNTVPGALDAAQLFNSNDTIPGDLLSGLSDQQLSECLNWDFAAPPQPQPIPTLSEWGLIAVAVVLGLVGFMVIRRRKVTA